MMALPATTAATAALPRFSPAAPKFRISIPAPRLRLNSRQTPSRLLPSLAIAFPCGGGRKSPRVRPCSAAQHAAVVEERVEGAEEEAVVVAGGDERRKLYVVNLTWSFSATDIKNLFSECGTVKDVEIIKSKNGKSRGFAFVTMGSGEEAQAAMDKFDSYELMGRIIRVEFAKSLKKPSPPLPSSSSGPVGETGHKIYASNLAWKVRSSNLREFFSENFKPISARVVFDSPSGKSGGYGFVSFSTKEEMEAAISELDGKDLMGRPLRLRISERKGDESGSEEAAADTTEGEAEES